MSTTKLISIFKVNLHYYIVQSDKNIRLFMDHFLVLCKVIILFKNTITCFTKMVEFHSHMSFAIEYVF